MKPNEVAIRKRSQIAKANRTMFLWIAISSALIGAAVVVSIFLFQKMIFNERVLAEKQNTVSTLQHNNSIVSSLEDEVRILDTNTALASVKANANDQALQVILDALPSEPNSLALGASLQNKLLVGLPIESLQVDPIIGVEALSGDDSTVDASEEAAASQITFQFTVKGSEAALKQVLQNLERSIRVIEITSLRIETSGGEQQMSVQARAFYEPAKTIELTDKVIKP